MYNLEGLEVVPGVLKCMYKEVNQKFYYNIISSSVKSQSNIQLLVMHCMLCAEYGSMHQRE